jgi:hypothetical protein
MILITPSITSQNTGPLDRLFGKPNSRSREGGKRQRGSVLSPAGLQTLPTPTKESVAKC